MPSEKADNLLRVFSGKLFISFSAMFSRPIVLDTVSCSISVGPRTSESLPRALLLK